MTHIDHLVAVVESEAVRAKAVVEALEAFKQTTGRATAEHDGSLRRLDAACKECSKQP